MLETCRKTVFTNMLHVILDCSNFAKPGRERATLGSDSGNTGTVCMKGVIYFR